MIDNGDAIEFERVSIADLQRAAQQETKPAASPPPVHPRTATAQQEELRPEAIEWLAGLPDDVRPKILPERFTRIVNRLCAIWKQPEKCEAYLRELMWDRRGGRQGFPLAIVSELAQLNDHYETLHPHRSTVWEHNAVD